MEKRFSFLLDDEAYEWAQLLMKDAGAESVGDLLVDAINFSFEAERKEPFSSYVPMDPVRQAETETDGSQKIFYRMDIDFYDEPEARIQELAAKNLDQVSWIGNLLIDYALFVGETRKMRERALPAWLFSPASPS